MKFSVLAAPIAALLVIPANAGALTLNFVGQKILPTSTTYAGTVVGGLSGIDHVGGGQYIAISDDRSQINPARYYDLDFDFSGNTLNDVSFKGVNTLKNTLGDPYPAFTIDPESIRKLPNGNIIYTSEGDTNRNIDAFIREATPDGTFVRDYALPTGFQQTNGGPSGIRNNLAFESLTVGIDGTITSATENALVQDGPAAAFNVLSVSRLFTYAADGTPGAQYAYQVSAVAHPTTPAGQFSTNGLVELLDLGGGEYIAVERSFVSGYTTAFSNTGNSIQLYLIDTNGATDVSGLTSLVGETYSTVSKELLLDLDTLQIPLDNIEAITIGERLPNRNLSLILASDNNFSSTQFTQFLAFEIVGTPAPAALGLFGLGVFGIAALRRR